MLSNQQINEWVPTEPAKNSNYSEIPSSDPVAFSWGHIQGETNKLHAYGYYTMEGSVAITTGAEYNLTKVGEEKSSQPQILAMIGIDKPRYTYAALDYDENQKFYIYTRPTKEIPKDLGSEYINNLINFNYELLKPIEVKMKEVRGEFIGSIDELELHAWGDDRHLVLREINENLTRLFEKLISIDDRNLGKYPKNWKKILNSYVTTKTK